MTNYQKGLLDELVTLLRYLDNQCERDKKFAQQLNNYLVETVWSAEFNHFVPTILLTMNPKTIREEDREEA